MIFLICTNFLSIYLQQSFSISRLFCPFLWDYAKGSIRRKQAMGLVFQKHRPTICLSSWQQLTVEVAIPQTLQKARNWYAHDFWTQCRVIVPIQQWRIALMKDVRIMSEEHFSILSNASLCQNNCFHSNKKSHFLSELWTELVKRIYKFKERLLYQFLTSFSKATKKPFNKPQ